MNISFADMNFENESCESFKGFSLLSSSAAALIGFVVFRRVINLGIQSLSIN